MHSDEFLIDLARGAGDILRCKYQTGAVWRQKTSRADIVTEVDEESERYLIDRITSQCPDDCILSEESGSLGAPEGEYCWVLDPLDGTTNYRSGIPFFCVSIAVLRGNSPVAGVICDPIHDEMFFARRGQGAFLNGKPIRVDPDESLEDAMVSVSWVRRSVDGRRFVEIIDDISKQTSLFRRFGAAALVMCYVACGRVHAYLQGGLNPWDAAAGLLIIEEAGGVVTDFAGRPVHLDSPRLEVLTANPALHSTLLDLVTAPHR